MGICHRAAGRRYRVKFKTYRFYGQRKRCQMLKRLHTSRATQAQKLPHLVKQAKPLPMISQLSTWVCGLLGVRVGEASHPGPAKIGTKRKAENEPQSHDDADAGLANALLNVLQQYQGEPNTRPYQVGPPVNKKRQRWSNSGANWLTTCACTAANSSGGLVTGLDRSASCSEISHQNQQICS